MELTKKKAIDLSIELWKWCAETGKYKHEWPEWKENGGKYERVKASCFLCEYAAKGGCPQCPYYKKFGHCTSTRGPYYRWEEAVRPSTSKKYAALFLEQLKQL